MRGAPLSLSLAGPLLLVFCPLLRSASVGVYGMRSDVLQTGRRGIIRASARVLLIGRCVDDGKNGFV